ncbi:hypothetical protein PVL29_015586 [Vitis rotundifolia]|uniref:Receptor-like serine/threonine-protein kinase n=1 Tax=Vitis rotundifolia TaxID=103349 RepID=A0AA38ZD36_VITRO|nr:hypothetical protein PVL29_015586 [Vitis rotundifolia]
MGSVSASHMLAVICYFFLCCVLCSSAGDAITQGSWLGDDGSTLVSPAKIFELGFFTPKESSSNGRYVGIWFHGLKDKTVVWVANRDKPIYDTNGVFGIAEDGKLKVLDETGQVYCHSDVETSSSVGRVVKLMDSGNLVLMLLISPANYTFKLDEDQKDKCVIWRTVVLYWRSVESEGTSDEMRTHFTTCYSISAAARAKHFKYTPSMVRLGMCQMLVGNSVVVTLTMVSCANACGKFGSCNANNGFMCKCLPGFDPVSLDSWKTGEFSSGCTRKSPVSEKNSSEHTFLSLKMMKVQKRDSSILAACLNSCQCLAYAVTYIRQGRSGAALLDCLIWVNDLKTLQEEYAYQSYNLFVRVPISDIESTVRSCETCGSNKIPYPLSTGSKCGNPMYSSFSSDSVTGQVLFKVAESSDRVSSINPESSKFVIQLKSEVMKSADCCSGSLIAQIPLLDLPFHMTGACNASETDKLSSKMSFKNSVEIEISWDPPPEPVYGMRKCFWNENFKWDGSSLNCTQEHGNLTKTPKPANQKPLLSSLAIVVGIPVAVALVALVCIIGYMAYLRKRAITNWKENRATPAVHLYDSERRAKHLIDSEQFREEDKKGIDVPFFHLEDKLAATNNFSDANKLGQGGFGPVYKVIVLNFYIALIFNYRTLCMLLNWEKRFNIILGIARGLLHLHQDSRLKIIRRNLKTSNILIYDEMNPKISDFGLVRIFDSKQVEASTNRVVGTYGYMSPEYALNGFFSGKPDVFSFGVMVLEITKDPSDHHTMAIAVLLLSSDSATMPVPKEPAFVAKRDLSNTASSSSKAEASLKNELLASIGEGR